MCGILFIASAAGNVPEASGSASDCPDAVAHVAPFLQGLKSRGPDKTGIKTIYIGGGSGGGENSNDSTLRLTFAGSILQLRGHEPVSPPLIHPTSGNILLWNGEIFNETNEEKEHYLNIPSGGNDAEALLHALTSTSDIPAVFSSIHGPWACVFWHAETETLWFGRDVLGRRSLLAKWPTQITKNNTDNKGGGGGGGGSLNNPLIRVETGSNFILTSVSPLDPAPEGETEAVDGYLEVEPGLYKLQINKLLLNFRPRTNEQKTYERSTGKEGSTVSIPDNSCENTTVSRVEDNVAALKLGTEGLATAIDWQIEDIKAIKAYHRPENLIEPAVDDGEENSKNTMEENKDHELRQPHVELQEERRKESSINAAAAVEGVLRALRDAVRVRCHCIDTPTPSSPSADSSLPSKVSLETKEQQQEEQGMPLSTLPSSLFKDIEPAKLMILFSGGVDSTLLAALAHEYRPPNEPIDLVSICFAGGTSPDREAALSAFEELRKIAPNRPWRLIGADKVLEDVENARDRLLKLLYPSDTVMDLNIGAALWLAAAGEGKILRLGGDGGDSEKDKKYLGEVGMTYRSAARCVFLGHGADELFGGYGRHRTRFRNAGWQGLSDELALDMKRLWVRNLGRDDRLVADRGREARHPFLDERVILQALQYWPLSSLTDLRMDLGVGDKLVLREILRKLGLPGAAGRVKRAIQFGTRLAKVTNAAQFGGTRQANAKNAGRVRLGDLK